MLPGDQMTYTPDFAATVAYESLRVCRAAGFAGDALAQCVADRSDPKRFIIGDP